MKTSSAYTITFHELLSRLVLLEEVNRNYPGPWDLGLTHLSEGIFSILIVNLPLYKSTVLNKGARTCNA